MSKPTWTTKNGEVLYICDMTDSHLINTVKFLNRQAFKMHTDRILCGYANLACVGGEMAEYCLEQEIMGIEADGPDPYEINGYSELIEELEKRNLKRFLTTK